jgi:hypothetical protein
MLGDDVEFAVDTFALDRVEVPAKNSRHILRIDPGSRTMAHSSLF